MSKVTDEKKVNLYFSVCLSYVTNKYILNIPNRLAETINYFVYIYVSC